MISAFPHVEKIRFVSSGTEATMSAIRLARAYTERKYIVKFEGCYHGHADALLVKAGSGVATLGIPGSAGVPEEFTQFTLALPFNDADALEQAFKKFRHQIACVIVEPVVGNMGCVPPARGISMRCARSPREKSLLLFDEVMTGFRLAFGGAQELYAILPDLTTLGKIIGGGLRSAPTAARAKSWTSSRLSAPSIRPERFRGIRWPWPQDSLPCATCASIRALYPELEIRGRVDRGCGGSGERCRSSDLLQSRRIDVHLVLRAGP